MVGGSGPVGQAGIFSPENESFKMQVINLTHGAGNGVNSACLMTASNMLIGRGQDGDNNSCVCPILRAFIIPTNDRMPEHLLRKLYSPLVWEILGTKTNDLEVMQQRAFCFADWTVREIVPISLRIIGLEKEAKKLENLQPIVDKQTAAAAYAAARAAADAAADAAAATYAAARAATYAADARAATYAADARAATYAAARAAARAAADAAADAAAATYAAARAAAATYAAARAAADAADAAAATYAADARAATYAAARAAADAETIWRKCPEIIRRVAAIGDKRPVECVMSIEDLSNCLV